MKNLPFALFMILLLFACKEESKKSEIVYEDFQYPSTFKGEVVDDYHGTSIADPYRWLEDDNAEDTKAWVNSQNMFTNTFLEEIPFRKDLTRRLEDLWDYERVGTPFKEGGQLYVFKNDGLQNQSILYKMVNDDLVPVLDPNKFSQDGTSSLGGTYFDPSGRYVAYQISEGGSDWRKVKVRDLNTGKDLKDELNWIKFSGLSWADDGFYYSRYAAPDDHSLSSKNEYHSVYFHKLGDDQSQDELIYVDKDHAQRNAGAYTTDDGLFTVISTSESTSGNALRIRKKGDKEFKIAVADFEADYSFVEMIEGSLVFMTDDGAPLNKLVSYDYESNSFSDYIPEQDQSITFANVVGEKLYLGLLDDAKTKIDVYDLKGNREKALDLPGIGTVRSISGKKGDDEAFFSYSSFLQPSTIYSLDASTNASEVFNAPKLAFDPEEYITEQVKYKSKDGTEVPMFITYKKGLVKDGTAPTLLYGYGGFAIPILPRFNVNRIPIIENGGIYAVANIRGGSEYGSEWHEAGTKSQKQNVFDDFQAAAEYLIDKKYTSSDKLAIEGRSNGGLLVGACMTQRPDLYAVAFPGVGVLDMLRYHEFTIGWAWAGDYGRSDDPEAFKYLKEYSPLHNVDAVDYPSTLITTADHDDRVVPAHSFKFAAELQDKHTGKDPVMIRIETSAGHGAGKPTSKKIEEAVDLISFMYYNMGATINYSDKNPKL